MIHRAKPHHTSESATPTATMMNVKGSRVSAKTAKKAATESPLLASITRPTDKVPRANGCVPVSQPPP